MNTSARRWFLLLGAVLVVHASEEAKKEKAFSIFSVVNFENIQCRSQDTLSSGTTSNRNGTCFTSSECATKGGTASGNCASGFGVCCLFKVSSASSTINQNNTYIQNPSFPAVYTATTSLSYKVQKAVSSVCWLRLDFETFTTLGPANSEEVGGGVCRDTFKVVTQTKQQIPTICGFNSGQHLYVDLGVASNDFVNLDFTFTGASTIRTWEIKTTQLECSNPNRPPAGCLQYFTTMVGRITTFNFLDSATSHLASQDYSICVRKQDGFCCVQYQTCYDQSSAFALDATLKAQASDSTCSGDYLYIPGSNAVCSAANNQQLTHRYCGPILGNTVGTAIKNTPICDCTAPFNLMIHTDAVSDTAKDAANSVLSRGLCLDYTQLPCTTN